MGTGHHTITAAALAGMLVIAHQADARTIRIHGFLLHDGQPVHEPIDLVVLVYRQPHGGSWHAYRRFDRLAVEEGRFEIALNLAALNAVTGFLEYRLRPSGADRIYEVLAPRQPVMNPRGDRRTAAAGIRQPWNLQVVTAHGAGGLAVRQTPHAARNKSTRPSRRMP